tara:strand:+ start:238 stop:1176 length:939 start_codon:yes stop_codon:yes gene_type:complete
VSLDQTETCRDKMKILFENVDFNSRSGPNSFGSKLAKQFLRSGHDLVKQNPDVCLAFIQSNNNFSSTVLRLDGIYFNTTQDWNRMNEPIRISYDLASAVIVQSEFDRCLITKFFGERDHIFVIRNGTDLELIKQIPPADLEIERERVWMCASVWRPHKRLIDNIRFFQTWSKENDVLLIAGKDSQKVISDAKIIDDRIKLLGDLSWHQLVSCMKASKNFIHLAWLDHCPNVVVDARASGCKIFCSDSGGTKEIAGENAVLVSEANWDFSPTELYHPPSMDFFDVKDNIHNFTIDIETVSEKYLRVLSEMCLQ